MTRMKQERRIIQGKGSKQPQRNLPLSENTQREHSHIAYTAAIQYTAQKTQPIYTLYIYPIYNIYIWNLQRRQIPQASTYYMKNNGNNSKCIGFTPGHNKTEVILLNCAEHKNRHLWIPKFSLLRTHEYHISTKHFTGKYFAWEDQILSGVVLDLKQN